MSPEIAIHRHAGPRGAVSPGFRVTTFVPGDYVAVYDTRTGSPWGFTLPDPWAVGRAYRDLGPCFTGWFRVEHSHDAPLVCAGISNMSGGRFTAWALLSLTLLAGHPRAVGTARHWVKDQIRQRLPILMGEHGVQRLEADVPAGGLNFARAVGFKVESVMPRWHDGATFFKYVRFRTGVEP